MRTWRIAGAAFLALTFAGCGEGVPPGGAKTYAEMSPDDVIVQVNGHRLLKREMEDFWRLNERLLEAFPVQGRRDAERRVRQDMLAYPRKFIDQALLVDEAKRLRVLTEDQAASCVERLLSAVAQKKGMTKDEFLRKHSDSAWFHRRVAENRTWINALVSKDIPPIRDVTPGIVSNFLGVIAEETAAMNATNRASFATLEGIRRDVMSGRTDFTTEADRIGAEDWDLGEVSCDDIESDATVRLSIFRAKTGEVVGPFEDAECYSIYQVAGIVPAQVDSRGRETHPERRRVFRIALCKADEPVQMTFEQAESDLRHQFQMEAIDRRLKLLKTNGANRIVWPHGKNLWGKGKTDDANGEIPPEVTDKCYNTP